MQLGRRLIICKKNTCYLIRASYIEILSRIDGTLMTRSLSSNKHLNIIHPKIKLTLELEVDDSLSFLM